MARRDYPDAYAAVVAAIDPQTVDNAAVTSDWADMRNFDYVMFVVNVGATDITVDAKVQSADDASGTNAADISGLAVTQLGATDDNKQVVLIVSHDELNGDDDFAAVVVTVGDGTTGAIVSAVGIGFGSDYEPASNYDVASLAQIKKLGVS